MNEIQPVISAVAGVIGSRQKAAEILEKVAREGRRGHFPDDVTCEQLGQALERICLNATNNPFGLVMCGWVSAADVRANREHSFLRYQSR